MHLSLLRTTALAALAALALCSSAHALTLNSPGVVGVHNGKLVNASIATEIAAAQHLLDMLAGTHEGAFSAADNLYLWQTSNTEYAATLVGGLKSDLTASGWDWGFAKYDGPNAGYVLFYLGGAAANTVVPLYPATLWTTRDQYALSHLTVFNQTQTEVPPPSVPDGGATAALLGLGLFGCAMVARRRA